jgi:TPR repeat protein
MKIKIKNSPFFFLFFIFSASLWGMEKNPSERDPWEKDLQEDSLLICPHSPDSRLETLDMMTLSVSQTLSEKRKRILYGEKDTEKPAPKKIKRDETVFSYVKEYNVSYEKVALLLDISPFERSKVTAHSLYEKAIKLEAFCGGNPEIDLFRNLLLYKAFQHGSVGAIRFLGISYFNEFTSYTYNRDFLAYFEEAIKKFQNEKKEENVFPYSRFCFLLYQGNREDLYQQAKNLRLALNLKTHMAGILLLYRAAQQQHPQALRDLGLYYYNTLLPKEKILFPKWADPTQEDQPLKEHTLKEKALILWRWAGEKGERSAYYLIAQVYFNHMQIDAGLLYLEIAINYGVPKALIKGIKLFSKSYKDLDKALEFCNALPRPLFGKMLSKIAHYFIETEKQRALPLLRNAAQLGDSKAIATLLQMKESPPLPQEKP